MTRSIPGALACLVSLMSTALADEAEDNLRETMEAAIGDDANFRRVGPFLVGGPVDEAELDRMEGTITRSHEAMKKQFFDADADKLVAVYLFPTKDAYEAFCLKYIDERPSTPYGFYLRSRRALVMNIGTGTGTLVHEMTHALMDFDFPAAPSWFGEGFASLFEQSTTAGGKIRGLENWRLPLLQRAIQDGSVPTWETLSTYTGPGFYGDGSGLRYSAARYLCMYLQEKGLLESYYEKFRAAQKEDPSGYETLKGLFEEPIGDVEKKWKEWVKGLKFE